jgi:hypothetical protein
VRHQEIIFAVSGQTFYFDPPEGQPSGTPTVQVFAFDTDDTGTAESATSGACSVDSVSTTIATTAASAGDTSITVASGTSITRGRRYLLASTATGLQEWIEVAGRISTTARLRQPLVNDYAVGSTLKGCRISISVDSTWSSSVSKITDVLSGTWRTDVIDRPWTAGGVGYRLRWAYTVDSIDTVGVSFADLVRYQAKNLVTPLDVDRRFPGWLDRLPPDYREDQGQALIDEAFHAVKMDALADEQAVRRIRQTEVLCQLVVLRANLIAQEDETLHGGTNAEGLEAARRIYQQRYDQLMRAPKVPIDQTGGGAAGKPLPLPAWRR